MILKSFAKINWILYIVGEKDGHHMLDGVMETIGLYDIIEINSTDGEICTAYKDLPLMEGDLCLKAARLFFEEMGIKGGADIKVEKHIPMGAGLGGGSSNGACVLFGLNELYNNPLNTEELIAAASKIGADAAFFIEGGAQRARGKGEVLSPVKRTKPLRLLIAKPKNKGVSTPAAYKLYDSMPKGEKGDVEGMITALEQGDESIVARCMFNSLEAPALKLLPEIEQVKESMIKSGAFQTMMTGSGSAVVGLIGNVTINEEYLQDLWYWIGETAEKGIEILSE